MLYKTKRKESVGEFACYPYSFAQACLFGVGVY